MAKSDKNHDLRHTLWQNQTKIITSNANIKEISLHMGHWVLFYHIKTKIQMWMTKISLWLK